jgi:hypothetical protein
MVANLCVLIMAGLLKRNMELPEFNVIADMMVAHVARLLISTIGGFYVIFNLWYVCAYKTDYLNYDKYLRKNYRLLVHWLFNNPMAGFHILNYIAHYRLHPRDPEKGESFLCTTIWKHRPIMYILLLVFIIIPSILSVTMGSPMAFVDSMFTGVFSAFAILFAIASWGKNDAMRFGYSVIQQDGAWLRVLINVVIKFVVVLFTGILGSLFITFYMVFLQYFALIYRARGNPFKIIRMIRDIMIPDIEKTYPCPTKDFNDKWYKNIIQKIKFFVLNNIVSWSIVALFIIIMIVNIIESAVVCSGSMKTAIPLFETLFFLGIGYILVYRLYSKLKMQSKNCNDMP